MVKKVQIIWSEHAESDLKNIYNYYADISVIVAKKIINGIIKKVGSLKHGFNKIGQKEILLENRKFEYRYMIYKNYKIIYRSDDDSIIIVTLFDSRQNPDKLSDSIK